jgi:hypothetical protein
MKSIQDHPEFQQASSVMDDLAAKKELVDADLNALLAVVTSNAMPIADDGHRIKQAAAIEPGLECPAVDNGLVRLGVLTRQSAQLHHAMALQSDQISRATSIAGRAVFASNATAYLEHATATLALIDKLVEQNLAVGAELAALNQRGCAEISDMRFPDFGLCDQLPYWRKDYAERIRALNLLVEANA